MQFFHLHLGALKNNFFELEKQKLRNACIEAKGGRNLKWAG